jgi:HAD superfamily hydrolase (TIGR01509 family)
MIQAVVFDLWNTLAKKNSVTSALKEKFPIGSNPHFTSRYEGTVQRYFWRDLEDLASYFLDQYGLENTPENRVFVADTFSGATQGAQLLPGTREMLQQLYPYYKLGLLSNTTPSEVLRPEWGIDGYFSSVVYSFDHGELKPSPESFYRVCEELNTPLENTLFIDDTLKNVEAARRLGMEALHFQGREKLKREMQLYGIYLS